MAAAQLKPPKKRLPFGLRAIIVLQLLTVLGNLLLLGSIAAAFAIGNGASLDLDLGDLDLVFSALSVVTNAICAIGLWRRQRWAWYLTMLQVGVVMAGDLASYFGNQPINEYWWSMLLNVAIVFYLNQREVQNVFRKEAQEPREVYAP